MTIDYEQLIHDPRVLKKISKEKLAEYLEDEDALPNDVESGTTVLSLGWDSNGPGGSGAIWITCWEDLYFCSSSDYDSEGPFDSLDEALQVDWFSNGTSSPELASEVLPLAQLKNIALGLLEGDGEQACINGDSYISEDGKLVPWSGPGVSTHEDDDDG